MATENTNAAQPVAVPADEREAFEAWVKSKYLDPSPSDLDAWGTRTFKHDFVEAMWVAWQARAATPQPKAEHGWVCAKCGVDRTRAACPKGYSASLTGDCPSFFNAAAIAAATKESQP